MSISPFCYLPLLPIQVLEVLCSLCVGNDIAVRTNQNLICDNLLPSRDLLLQTKVVDTVIRCAN